MVIRRVSLAATKQDDHAVWNTFVDLLANSNYGDLNDAQRPAHLAFWYESEVQNGGHLQFLENRPGELIEPTLTALHAVGADGYVAILREALDRYRSQRGKRITTVEDYVLEALHGEFEDLDRAYYDTKPPMTELLEKYLSNHFGDFILLED